MKNRHLSVIIVWGTVVLACLIAVQIYWFSRAFSVAEKQFDHSVQIALKKVADSLSTDHKIKKLSSNFFFVDTHAGIDDTELDRLIKKAISQGPANPVLLIILNTIKAIKQTAATGRAIFVMVSYGL